MKFFGEEFQAIRFSRYVCFRFVKYFFFSIDDRDIYKRRFYKQALTAQITNQSLMLDIYKLNSSVLHLHNKRTTVLYTLFLYRDLAH